MRLFTVLGTLFLSGSIIAAAHAAPVQKAPGTQRGMKNAKKVMQARMERDKKQRAAQKQALTTKLHSRAAKASADTGKQTATVQ